MSNDDFVPQVLHFGRFLHPGRITRDICCTGMGYPGLKLSPSRRLLGHGPPHWHTLGLPVVFQVDLLVAPIAVE